jgi:hypothetical protein
VALWLKLDPHSLHGLQLLLAFLTRTDGCNVSDGVPLHTFILHSFEKLECSNLKQCLSKYSRREEVSEQVEPSKLKQCLSKYSRRREAVSEYSRRREAVSEQVQSSEGSSV